MDRSRRAFLTGSAGLLVVACGGSDGGKSKPADAQKPAAPAEGGSVATPEPTPEPAEAPSVFPAPRTGDRPQAAGTMIGPGRLKSRSTGDWVYLLGILDLATGKPRHVELDFFGHGLVPNPVEPHKAALFEKIGKGAAEVDLRAGKALRKIETVENRLFYGHGAYSKDGSLLYATETDTEDDYKGVIAVRDPATMKQIGAIPSFGVGPHDCHLLDDGTTLVITNGGHPIGGRIPPSVTYVDLKAEKLLDEVVYDQNRFNTGHLAITGAGDLVVVHAPRDGLEDQDNQPGGISFRPKGAEAKLVDDPADVVAKMKGETLSVAIHEPTGMVGATNPRGSLVSFWNIKTGESAGSVDLHRARGIAVTLDGEHFAVTHGDIPVLRLFDARTLEQVGDDLPNALASGSHIVMYEIPA